MLFQILKRTFFIIMTILVLLAQFSFIPSLPYFFQGINLPLVVILLVLIFSGSRDALVAAFIFGFVMDSWHFSPFGVYLFSFLAVILCAVLVLNNWLTDRSLYSFAALALINSFIFSIVWSSLNFLFSLGSSDGIFFLFSWGFLKFTIFSAFWLVSICVISFFVLSLVSNRLKPVFLKKR